MTNRTAGLVAGGKLFVRTLFKIDLGNLRLRDPVPRFWPKVWMTAQRQK